MLFSQMEQARQWFRIQSFEVELHFMEELTCQLTWKVNHAS